MIRSAHQVVDRRHVGQCCTGSGVTGEMQVRRKVVVYCVRGEKLLVFTHRESLLMSGIQVPAGSVRDGEAPVDAAHRELSEETQREDFAICSFLGCGLYDQRPYRDEIHERFFYLAVPTADLPDKWSGVENHDGLQSPTVFDFFWIPLRLGHVLVAGQGALLGVASALLAERGTAVSEAS